MKHRVSVLFAVLGVLVMGGLVAAGGAQAATYKTREGLAIELSAAQQSVKKIAPLDSSPLSGGALLSSDVHAAIRNIGDKKVKATVEVGYKIGYPVSFAPEGVKVTLHTPDLKVNGGVAAKFSPNISVEGTGGGGSLGELGAEAGAESTIIPSADVEFSVEAGKINTVSLAEFSLTKPTADVVLSGVELNVSNAVGPISVRPFAKITVVSEEGSYTYFAHGKTTKI